MAVLRVIEGSEAGRTLTVTEGALIGRAAECDVVVSSPAVSRQHARIEESGGHYFLEDLKSRNGVQVNQRPIGGRIELRDGDRIRLADVVIAFQERANKDDTVGKGRLPTQYAEAEHVEEQWSDQSTIGPRLATRESLPESQVDASAVHPSAVLLAFGRRMAEIEHCGDKLAGPLSTMLAAILEAMPRADDVVAMVHDGDPPQWRTAATRGRRGEPERVDAETIAIARCAVEARQTMTHLATPLSTAAAEAIASLPVRTVVCSPLLAPGHEPFGVLLAYSQRGRASFDASDLELLTEMSRQVGIGLALERHRARVQEQANLESELSIARSVQQSFLPRKRPSLPGYEVAEFYQPLGSVGGDYYDYIALADGRMAIVIGDVSGQGVPAALVMARISAALPLHLASAATPAEAMARLNVELMQIDANRFATMCLLLLDPKRNEFVSICAGHLPPVRLDEQGRTELIGRAESDLPLGVIETTFHEVRFRLRPGESLILATDGIVDACGPDRITFGMERLRTQSLQAGLAPAEQVNFILQSVSQWRRGETWNDDVCIVCMRRLPAPAIGREGGQHALFDARSIYSKLRAALSPADKIAGYFLFHGRRGQAPPGESRSPTIVVFAASVVRDEGRPQVRRLEPGAAACGFREPARAEKEFYIDVDELPIDDSLVGGTGRALIVEPKAMARLRSAAHVEAQADADWFEMALGGEVVGARADVARILSALPELEASVSPQRRLEFVSPVAVEATPPSSGALIVIIIDAADD